MRKVLLVIEDYNELLFLETLLKKVGFDVETSRSELSLSDKMMAFPPDLVIATGEGNKISGQRVSRVVRKARRGCKLLLLFPRARLQQEQSLNTFNTDGAIETPLNPRAIITSVCNLTGVDLDSVMTKFEKLPIAKEAPVPEGIQIITSKLKVPKESRKKNYAEFVKEAPKAPDAAFPHKFVQNVMDENKKAPPPPNWEKIEEERLKFVKALFKKK